MNNKIVIGVVVAIVVIGSIFYFTKNTYAPKQQPANTITIRNFSFTPGTLTVSQGTTVTWVNQDATVHSIKSDTFSSSALNKGGAFSFTFDAKGSFEYRCGVHPSMTGKIVVE